MTLPAATVSLASCSVVTRPSPPSWLAAADDAEVGDVGDDHLGRPFDTVSLTTVLPGDRTGRRVLAEHLAGRPVRLDLGDLVRHLGLVERGA